MHAVVNNTDLEGALTPLPGWDTEWIHLGPGPMNHDVARVAFRRGTFSSLRTSSAGILRGSIVTGSVAVITSLPESSCLRAGARPVGGNTCVVLGPTAAFDLYLPDGGGVIILALTLPLPVPLPAAEAERERFCVLDAALTAQLVRCAELLEQVRAAAAPSPESRNIQRRVRALLSSTTEALFRAGPPPDEQRARLQRHLAVIRACAYIDAHLRLPIALADLCAAAGVSTRALEYGFHDFYDIGPMAYVRNLRLCRVRHDLLDPARKGDSVSNTARRWSFTHMGQFGHDYRTLFGEMPSMTLMRQHRAPASQRERKTFRGAAPQK